MPKSKVHVIWPKIVIFDPFAAKISEDLFLEIKFFLRESVHGRTETAAPVSTRYRRLVSLSYTNKRLWPGPTSAVA